MPKILLIVSQFNSKITDSLYEAAVTTFLREGFDRSELTKVEVPGAFELPLVAKLAGQSRKWDAIICLGCVIRGGTPHFDYVCAEAARGIMQAGLDSGVPTIFGVLTTDTEEQALARSGLAQPNKGQYDIKPIVENKGVDAALAACTMLQALASIK